MEAPRRDPIERHEPIDRERFEPRVVERDVPGALNVGLFRDITRWGPVFGGFLATTATAILLSILGGALGITAANQTGPLDIGSTAAIWGGIVMLISFFIGGYLASRAAAPGGVFSAVLNSSLVWALAVVFGVMLAAIGLGSLVGLMGWSVPPLFDSTPGTADPVATANTLWAAFIGMILALAAAIVGGLVGMRRDVVDETSRTYR
jgi:hypothetical protein